MADRYFKLYMCSSMDSMSDSWTSHFTTSVQYYKV